MWRTLSYSFLVLLSASALAFSLSLFSSQTAHAVSAYDDVVEYVEEFTFMGTQVKSIDDFTALLREKSTCSSSVIALLDYDAKYMSESSSNALFVSYLPASNQVVFANGTGSTGLNWFVAGTPAVPRVVITNSGSSAGRYYSVSSSGNCTTATTGLNYSTPLLAQGDKLFFTRGNVFSEPKATYPAGYEGTKFKQSVYVPPSPAPSGDAITKAEMEEITHESLEYQRRLAVTIFGLAVSVLLAYAISMKISRIGR